MASDTQNNRRPSRFEHGFRNNDFAFRPQSGVALTTWNDEAGAEVPRTMSTDEARRLSDQQEIFA